MESRSSEEGGSVVEPRSHKGSGTAQTANDPHTSQPLEEDCLLIIDSRALDRECLAQSLIAQDLSLDVVALGSIDEWWTEKDFHRLPRAILVSLGKRKIADSSVADDITRLVTKFQSVPIVVLADSDELTEIVTVLDYGARGYIPTSVGIAVCVQAIRLAIAGGVFVPASSVLATKHLIGSDRQEDQRLAGLFSPREAEVVRALRQGKQNKIIACELTLRESTVKVHIRNIMKKLKATNRTEVAYKIDAHFSQTGAAPGQ